MNSNNLLAERLNSEYQRNMQRRATAAREAQAAQSDAQWTRPRRTLAKLRAELTDLSS